MSKNSIQGKLLLKSIYPLVASLFMTFFAFGQSETNNPITYDTTITENAGGPSYTWYVRITRQANDRTPRPAIFSMQGTGEVGSNPGTLLTYGPHWWLANGWDGSVKLGNGTHYPVLVTIMEPAQNMRPWDLKVVFEALLKALPINKNAVHVAGLSQGNFEWGELLSYSAYAGDHTTMGEIKSMVDLEGVGPGVNYSGYNLSYPGVFGYWARHYNGKFFGLEGSTDDQFVYPISENMNDSVPGSAFFAFENLGGGGHCCWNSMYDPSATNWTNSSPNVVSGNTQHPNTPGDYKAGSNIFQWELRQGDTTLAGSSAATVTPPTVTAGSDPTITLPTNSATLTGSATATSGTTISSEAWTQTSGPSTATISKPTGSVTTTVSNLVAGTYVFTFTATNNSGQSASSTVDVVVKAAATTTSTVPVVSAGSAQSLSGSSSFLQATATAASGTTLSSESWKETSGPNSATINQPTGSLSTAISNLVAGTYVFTFTATNSLGQSTSSTINVVVKAAASAASTTATTTTSTAPVVSAGSAQSLSGNSSFLQGTATAASGTTLSTETWKETSGPNSATINQPTGSLSTAISNLVAGTYVFTFTATNNLGQSASSTISVVVKTATSTAPVVSAGSAQTLSGNSSFLQGTATAASGTTLSSESWKETSGPNTATINKPSGSLSTAISGLEAGTYVFTLTATNNLGQSASSTVSVKVNGTTGGSSTDVKTSSPDATGSTTSATSTLPVVSAGSAQSLSGNSTFLQGTAKAASGTTLSSESWKQSSGPNTATINKPTGSLSTAISGLEGGTYVFTLYATNNLGQTANSSVTVTVDGGTTSTASTAPTLTVEGDPTITLPTSSVTLTSTATAASGTTLVSGIWKETSGPVTAIIASATSSNTAVTGLTTAGTYIFSYTITNNKGQTATGNTTVIVKPATTTSSSSTVPVIVSTGEYQTLFIDQSKHLWSIGGNLNTLGSNNVGIEGAICRVLTSPTDLQFSAIASGLHGGAAVDVNGYVWGWGQDESGELGNGTISNDMFIVPVKILTDVTGAPFNNVSQIYCYYANSENRGGYAIKNDGTLWIWGDAEGGMLGNGTKGGFITRPTQIVLPGGRKAKQLAAGNTLVLLCTDGTVWTCGGSQAGENPNLGYESNGNDYLTLHQINLPTNIVQVAGATNEFSYALTSTGTLYGWGRYGSYMGGTGGYAANIYLNTPTDLTSRLNLPHPVRSITANMVCSHAILTDGTLWGWGDNAQGGVGNGHELNFANTTVPYTWDFGPAELLQQAPVQITTRNDFVAVWGAGPFVLFDFAETADGQLYSWGRNKGAVLGNGIIGCTPPIQASYPNSWDVTTATAVNPLAQTTVKYVASPYCTAHPLVGQCPSCLLAVALQNPTAVASVSATTATNAVLTATSITTSTPTTTATTGSTGTILESSPTEGTGTAALSTNGTAATTTDTTATDAASTTPAGIVSTTTGTLRVQSAGSFTVATLDGSQSRSIDSTGTIVSYRWSQAAGPQTIIRDTTAATTDVIGLAPGTYAFRLTVTDNEGRSSSAVDSLIIGNASPSGLPGADATNTAGLAAYPTVAHSNVNLVLNSDQTGTVRLNVYSSTGSLVQAQQLSKGQTEMVTNLDISSLAAGVYIVQALVDGQTSFTTKFIKQ